jgi:hypothetical protein
LVQHKDSNRKGSSHDDGSVETAAFNRTISTGDLRLSALDHCCWLPFACCPDGLGCITSFIELGPEGERFMGIEGFAPGHWIVAIGVVLLLLSLFRLTMIAYAVTLLPLFLLKVSSHQPYGTTSGYARLVMFIAIVILFVASVRERRVRQRVKDAATAQKLSVQ